MNNLVKSSKLIDILTLLGMKYIRGGEVAVPISIDEPNIDHYYKPDLYHGLQQRLNEVQGLHKTWDSIVENYKKGI